MKSPLSVPVGSVPQCDLCPRHCPLSEGQPGFCGVRTVQNGTVVSLSYGKTTGFAVDPIEKKPLNHFYPGSKILSFGGIGCNLACKFCQNASTAQSRNLSLLATPVTPDDVVQLAKQHHCESVAFTYNEPIISAEFVQDVAAACRSANLKTVAVSNGFIAESCRTAFFDSMNAANIDLKSFSEAFYRDYCGGELEPVKETLRYLAKSNTWLEVTTLLIPTLNDSEQEIGELCTWFAKQLGREIPLHFSAFRPANKLQTLPPTPPQTLFRAREIAMAAGLRFAYTGNIDDPAGQSTYCPQCGQTVISRDRYIVDEYEIDEESCCKFCGQTINGRFADTEPIT
jgi:pyruvate formate lyase activating enzyme